MICRTILNIAFPLAACFLLLTPTEAQLAQNQPDSRSNPQNLANSLSQSFVLEIKQVGAPTQYLPISGAIQYNPRDPNGNLLQSDWINIQSSLLGHVTKVTVSYISRSANAGAMPGKRSERIIATCDLSIGQSVLISELEQLNLTPIEISVISQKPADPTPLTVINRTASLEVVAIEEAAGKRYSILLKNNSQKKIIGIGFQSGGVTSSRMGTAIMPGSTESVPWRVSYSILSGGEYIPNPGPPSVIISTVIFEDSSYEGEPEPVASHEVWHQIEKLHAILIIPVLNEALSRLETEAAEAVVQFLHDRLAIFPEQAASDLINSVVMKYPRLTITPQYKRILDATSKSRWESLNTLAFRNLETNAMFNGAIDAKRLQTWLRAESDRCRKFSQQP